MWIPTYITAIPVNRKCKYILHLILAVNISSYIYFPVSLNTIYMFIPSCCIPLIRTYPFCPIGDYQHNGQSYYATTHTANYSTAVPLNAPTVPHPSTLPYIVPTEETLLLNAASQTHNRDSPHSLTVSKCLNKEFPQHIYRQTQTSTNIFNIYDSRCIDR